MAYSINVYISDEDYFRFNKFSLIKSYNGKKQMLIYRFVLAAIILLFPIMLFFKGDFSYNMIIPYLFLLIISQILIKPIYLAILKAHLKMLRKNGKAGYNPTALIEFSDEEFTETTPDSKSELKYSSIERVSVYEKNIYIHINALMAYILPYSAFESEDQFSEFIEFIKTKCNNVDIY